MTPASKAASSALSPEPSLTREPSEAQPKPRQEVAMPVAPSVTCRMILPLACPPAG